MSSPVLMKTLHRDAAIMMLMGNRSELKLSSLQFFTAALLDQRLQTRICCVIKSGSELTMSAPARSGTPKKEPADRNCDNDSGPSVLTIIAGVVGALAIG